MPKKTPIIDLKNAAASGIGIEKPTSKNLDYLRVGYTDNDCPGPLLFTTPVMKLIKVNKKNNTLVAKFQVKRRSFVSDAKKVIDPAMKQYIANNTEALFGKKSSGGKSRYIPFIYTSEDGEDILRLDVTDSVLYNESNVVDEDGEISSCIGQYFRAAAQYRGLQLHGKKYRADCCALQLKVVSEKYIDPKTDVECGYETEAVKN